MGTTILIKYMRDWKEEAEIIEKVLFNISGCNVCADEIIFFNIDGSPVFRLLLSELVSIDFN